jgi:hypothetical protein
MNQTVMDLMDENYNVTDKNGMDNKIGENLTFVEFFRLRNTLLRIKNTIVSGEGRIKSMDTLLHYKKMGGGILRRLINVKIPDEKTMNIKSVKTTLGGMTVSKKELAMYLGLWEHNCLTADIKMFIFKFIHGQLYLNSTRAHFDRTINPGCTFCIIRQRGAIEPEKVGHLFWECAEMDMVKGLIQRKTGNQLTKKEFLIGSNRWAENKNKCWGWLMMVVKHYIFMQSRRNRLMVEQNLEHDIATFEQSLEGMKYRGIVRTFWV